MSERERQRPTPEELVVIGAAIWVWSDRLKRYRNVETGRYVTQRVMLTLRDYFTEAIKAESDTIVRQLAGGEISLGRWHLEMQARIKQVISDQYALSVGGRNAMTQADWGRVGHMVKRQYGYLERFAMDIRAGKLSEGQIRMRARMYMNSGTSAYEVGNAVSRGVLSLPAYPGDGQTICRTNCQCHWLIDELDDRWEATWRLGAAEHCPDCVDNASRWAPLVVSKGG